MTRGVSKGRLLVAALAFSTFCASAQTCTPPAPLAYLGQVRGSSEWTGSAGTTCGLHTQIDANSRSVSGAYANGTLAVPRKRLRASFNVDYSGLAAFTALQAVTLIRLVAATTPTEPANTATIAQLSLGMLNPSSGEFAAITAAKAADAGFGYHSSAPLPASRSISVALEATIGSQGTVRYWINAGFDDPPTGSVVVDNAPWQTIAGVALGEFSATMPFIARQGDRTVEFSDIRIDDYLFWDHFD